MKTPTSAPPEVMIIWGYNIPATCPDNLFGHWIIDMMKQGHQDHLHGPQAVLVRLPLQALAAGAPRAADAALAMGMLGVIIDRRLFCQEDGCERWTNACHLVRTRHRQAAQTNPILENRGGQENYAAWDEESPAW
jgi:hypothetical protein